MEALDLFKDMRTQGVEPDSLTFKYLINGLLDEGRSTLAYELHTTWMPSSLYA
uniref:Pentacotripeptide-repeat region of PRORP domain-containing protein n=1 Tax=Aegilops tauschii subsp. strangulata TaxID=200361 RepID=A0A453AM27_AEGTS